MKSVPRDEGRAERGEGLGIRDEGGKAPPFATESSHGHCRRSVIGDWWSEWENLVTYVIMWMKWTQLPSFLLKCSVSRSALSPNHPTKSSFFLSRVKNPLIISIIFYKNKLMLKYALPPPRVILNFQFQYILSHLFKQKVLRE